MENSRLAKGIRLAYLVFGIATLMTLIGTVILFLTEEGVLRNSGRDIVIVGYLLYPVVACMAALVHLLLGIILRKHAPVPIWVCSGILLPTVMVFILRLVERTIICVIEFEPVFMAIYVLWQTAFLVLYTYFLKKNWKIKKELSA